MKQIIAMGGGGFTMEPENPLLDRYIIEQSGKKDPKICFLPTASAENVGYTLNFYKAFSELGCHPSHLGLFQQPQKDLLRYLLQHDILYVGGGNTRCMLALWREWGLGEMLRTAWEEGVLLAGISAGAICWFEQGVTDSVPGDLTAMQCLGYLPGSCCPHYDGETKRRPSFQQMISDGLIKPGYALDDGAAVHFIEDDLAGSVSSRLNARVYWVDKPGEQVEEKPLPTRFLG